MLDLRAATMLASASKALRGYNDELAERALKQSRRLMKRRRRINTQYVIFGMALKGLLENK